MSKGVKALVNLMVDKLQLPKHNGVVATFLKKEDHGREFLGLHWADKNASIKAKRRLRQCVSLQFPCALMIKLWGMWENNECHLCRRLYPEGISHAECLTFYVSCVRIAGCGQGLSLCLVAVSPTSTRSLWRYNILWGQGPHGTALLQQCLQGFKLHMGSEQGRPAIFQLDRSGEGG